MATKATSGFGGKFEVQTGNSVWTECKQIQRLSFSGVTSEFADTTNLNSVNRVKEFIPTTTDPGTVTIEFVVDQADPGQLALLAGQVNATRFPCRVTYPPQPGYTTGLVRSFAAYVQKSPFGDLNTTDATKSSVELKVDGAFTDTPPVAAV